MSIEIFYLSGTGNSLHVAKELQNRLSDTKLIPLASLSLTKEFKTGSDTIGFIFPVHFMTAPGVVFHFLENLDMQSAKYVFAIATRYGTPCGVMYKRFDKILMKKDKCLDSYVTITMANNDPKFKFWEPVSQEALDTFEYTLQRKLDLLCEYIMKKEKYHEPDREVTFKVNPMMERLGALAISLIGDGKEQFCSDSNCTGCGICESVCLSSKIKMINGKPEWLKNADCFSCYACLNYCPGKAIQLKSTPLIKYYTEQNGRYHHAKISAYEIAKQKHAELANDEDKG